MNRPVRHVLIGLAALLAWSCSDNGSTKPETHSRSYYMGFSFYPTVFQSAQPTQFVVNFRARADMVTIHWDGNVPWGLLARCDDLANCDAGSDSLLIVMQANLKETVDGLVVQTNSFRQSGDRAVYLATSPLNIDRDAIVNTYAGLRTDPPSPIFADPAVADAYKRFVMYLVEKFEPNYYSQVIELNMYAINQPNDFANLVQLAEETYDTVKAEYPSLPIAPTIQWEFYKVGWDTPGRRHLLDSLATHWVNFGDYFPISTYPNIQLDRSSVDSTWYRFDQYGLETVAGASLMISECGIQPLMQQDMLRTLSRLLESHGGIALDYFFLEDMDHLMFPPSFKDVGLYHDKQSPTLTPHPGLATWDSLFAL